jgi:phosphopantothenoylcysteine decarboxylase
LPAAQLDMRILWACTGSVATVKVPEAVLALLALGHEVRVVTTRYGHRMLMEGAAETYDAGRFRAFRGAKVEVLTDEDEWPKGYKVGRDPVLHIELRKWADVLVVAPLSANTLAKLAHGLCDNLLTCVARAWDAQKPVVLAPAMNTLMYENAQTARHLGMLPRYCEVVAPVVKTLACNDTGVGAMAAVSDLVEVVCRSAPASAALLASRL